MTALASWLYARKAHGAWLLRIDDLDTARCPPRHTTTILRQLEAHGLYWDETLWYQSQQRNRYRDAYAELRAGGRLYACNCTRRTLRRESRAGVDGPVYSGHCRKHPPTDAARAAHRLRVNPGQATLDDGIQRLLTRDVGQDIGDFVVQRADGLTGYHFACIVDEAAMRVTHVVRGADLIGATFCQRILQSTLGLASPDYCHLPVLLDQHGRKLSKQNHASPLDDKQPARNLHRALMRLGQNPPVALAQSQPRTVLAWALANWLPQQIPAIRHIGADDMD